MKRFILVSFAFLALAFYELSGGADFQPRVGPAQPDSDPGVAAITPSAKARPVKAATLVASPAIAPFQAGQTSPDPAPGPVDRVESADADIEAVAKLDQIRSSLNQGLSLFADSDPVAQPLMLASLEQGAAGMSTAPLADTTTPEVVEMAPPPADIREITGTRVNMRDGPGTIYPVISRLTIGREVEVLGESGTGWLRLRIMPERQIGWISASLVSKANR